MPGATIERSRGLVQCEVSRRDLEQDLGLQVEWPISMKPDSMTPGAPALVGFHNNPYRLDRDSVIPPIDLERQIFPIIEQHPGDMTLNAWKEQCGSLMLSPVTSFEGNPQPGAQDHDA
ncbi:hypothetical protein CPB97_006838 [Podila verticillata]|nr:hypothetical protein CPB97_006838 [Podila verticillata]